MLHLSVGTITFSFLYKKQIWREEKNYRVSGGNAVCLPPFPI